MKMKVSVFFLILALLASGFSACTQVPPLPNPDSYTGLEDANALGQEVLDKLSENDPGDKLYKSRPVFVLSLLSTDSVENAYYLYHLFDRTDDSRAGWLIVNVGLRQMVACSESEESHYEIIKREVFSQYDVAEIRYVFDNYIIFPILKLTGDYYFRYYWNDRELKEMEYKFSTISEAQRAVAASG